MQRIIPPSSKVFLVLCSTLLISGIILLSVYHKGDFVLRLNTIANPNLDEFFKLFTHLGLGGLLAILAVVFLFVRYYYSILLIGSLICAGLFTFLLKQVVFTHMPRPIKYFEPGTITHMISGIDYHHWGSFPSGHTMTAFAGSFVLTLIIREKQWGFVFFIIAFLVGISRVYLCQHFFMDVYVGGLIGTIYTFALHYLLGYKLGWCTKPAFNSNLIIKLKLRKSKETEVGLETAS